MEWLSELFSKIGSWELVFVALGVGFHRLAQWAGDWIQNKGSALLIAKVDAIEARINATSIGGALQADDEIFKILRDTIPVFLKTLTDQFKAALADGKITKEEWGKIGESLWDAAKPALANAKTDYLKNYARADGVAIATLVAKAFMAKRKAKELAGG
jgi:hypothetical protein